MTTTARVSQFPKCDLCKDSDIFKTPEDAQYDGKTTSGQWAYMCPVHFLSNGVGLGLGKGQKLITESEHTEIDINRADQLCAKCGKGCSVKSFNKEEIRYRLLDQSLKIELMLMTGLYCEEVLNF